MSIEELRSCFPQLEVRVYGKKLVYLDNAATSLRPRSVLDRWYELSSSCSANLHRAVHKIAADATGQYEDAREAVRKFLNAESQSEIIFTSGTTHSTNLVAYSFSEAYIREGDEVIVCECEHHSDIVPWQFACERKGATLKVLPVDEDGYPRLDVLKSLLTQKTRILCIAQISNVLGLENPVEEIVDICHSKGCKVLVDGAQGVLHSCTDVRKLGCDFYAFSGHKLFASPGTGVLYGRRELLEKMPPFLGGGEMIGNVSFTRTTFAPLPQKFEAGTQNISGTPTLVQGIAMLEAMKDKQIRSEYEAVRDYVLKALTEDGRIRLFGVPRGTSDKVALFSFVVEGAHHEDLALILDKMGVAVRSGQMCAEPLMDRYGVSGMVRASFLPYNTLEEAEYFIKSLDRAIDMLK
ncbi:MAG: SufS family cysteine desulfurase [Bacteroidia bacterium]|nr:SufS family cysteine desulfurase [Bacteroidia bacterium]